MKLSQKERDSHYTGKMACNHLMFIIGIPLPGKTVLYWNRTHYITIFFFFFLLSGWLGVWERTLPVPWECTLPFSWERTLPLPWERTLPLPWERTDPLSDSTSTSESESDESWKRRTQDTVHTTQTHTPHFDINSVAERKTGVTQVQCQKLGKIFKGRAYKLSFTVIPNKLHLLSTASLSGFQSSLQALKSTE